MRRLACYPLRQQLIDYAEGVLSESHSLRLERHLIGCSSCRRELEAIIEVEEALETYPVLIEPLNLVDSILLETRTFPQSRIRFVVGMMELVLATALATSVAFLVWVTLGTPLPQESEELVRFDDTLESLFGVTWQEMIPVFGQVLPWLAIATGLSVAIYIIAFRYTRHSTA